MYEEGRGVPQNYVYARMWLHIAVFGQRIFDEEMTSSQIQDEDMTPSQIQKAIELARAYIRKQYKDCEV